MAKAAIVKEVYLPDYKLLDDKILLELPKKTACSPISLFVCTYIAKLSNICIPTIKLTEIMCKDPRGVLVAFNSNYGHACQPGYEHLLKFKKPVKVPKRGKIRKVQGDGTCFNSAIEPILFIEHPGISPEKIYKVKCFPTTGETQIPGVICPDLSDGHAVLVAFVDYLNDLNVSSHAEDVPQIAIIHEQPKMLNYKFRVNRNSPRILINLHVLALYMNKLEIIKGIDCTPLTDIQQDCFEGWPVILLPPYLVRETKPPTDDVKVSFRFKCADRSPRINIFQEGKINILGADSNESALKIYAFFVQLFTANWAMFVCLQPRSDFERRNAAAKLISEPVQKLNDSDLDSLLDVYSQEENELTTTKPTATKPTAEESETEESETTLSTTIANIINGIDKWM